MAVNSTNQTIGRAGENLAASYLTSLGYQIIEKNFSTAYGEIDLIAQDGKQIVFVEVKTRRGTKFGLPEEAVDRQKVAKMTTTAQIWLTKNNINQSYRLDLVAILNGKISHYPNITGYSI